MKIGYMRQSLSKLYLNLLYIYIYIYIYIITALHVSHFKEQRIGDLITLKVFLK